MTSVSDAEGTDPFEPRSGAGPARRLGHRVGIRAAETTARARLAMREHPTARRVYRVGVGVVGGGTVVVGVILMPLPGPGTLISLGGLAILATEFEGARKLQDRAVATAKKAASGAKEATARRRARKAGQPADDMTETPRED